MSHPPAPDTTTTGAAPTRLCLGGEDLDWIGGPALLAAIELRVEVTYERQETSRTLTLRSGGALREQLSLTQPDWSASTNSELELIRLCWQHAARPIVGGRITIHSGAPASAGLASSAAACVAALRAFLPWWTQQEMSTDELIGAAYHLERDVAGRPVGPMDFVPAVLGGTTLISSASETITELTHLLLPPEARFVVVIPGRHATPARLSRGSGPVSPPANGAFASTPIGCRSWSSTRLACSKPAETSKPWARRSTRHKRSCATR